METPIIVYDMPNELYRKIDAISASDLKLMDISIDMFIKNKKLKAHKSSAMDMGTAVHTALLEPERFKMSQIKMKPSERQSVSNMIHNARVIFGDILSKTKNEVSVVSTDGTFTRKCRPDAMLLDAGVVFDLKTSRYGNMKDFVRYDVYGRSYHMQAAWYLDTLNLAGVKADQFVFLVVQSQAPYYCFAVEISRDIIEDGREKYGNILNRLQEYKENRYILDVKKAIKFYNERSL